MDKVRVNLLAKSFIISFVYVSLGTIAILSGYPSSPLYGGWVLPTMLLTFPVSIWSFGIVFADSHAFWSVIIVESVVCLLFWLIIFRWMKRRFNRKFAKK